MKFLRFLLPLLAIGSFSCGDGATSGSGDLTPFDPELLGGSSGCGTILFWIEAPVDTGALAAAVDQLDAFGGASKVTLAVYCSLWNGNDYGSKSAPVSSATILDTLTKGGTVPHSYFTRLSGDSACAASSSAPALTPVEGQAMDVESPAEQATSANVGSLACSSSPNALNGDRLWHRCCAPNTASPLSQVNGVCTRCDVPPGTSCGPGDPAWCTPSSCTAPPKFQVAEFYDGFVGCGPNYTTPCYFPDSKKPGSTGVKYVQNYLVGDNAHYSTGKLQPGGVDSQGAPIYNKTYPPGFETQFVPMFRPYPSGHGDWGHAQAQAWRADDSACNTFPVLGVYVSGGQ